MLATAEAANVGAAIVRQRSTKARFVLPKGEGSDTINVQVFLDGNWVAGTATSLDKDVHDPESAGDWISTDRDPMCTP